MMLLQIRLPEPDVDAVLDLRRWLTDEPQIRRYGRLEAPQPRSPGEMGFGLEVVSVALSSGLSALQLLISIAQWRDSRRASPAVIISRTTPDGVTVRIEASDPEILAEAARELEAD
jgi:hypothetical protein